MFNREYLIVEEYIPSGQTIYCLGVLSNRKQRLTLHEDTDKLGHKMIISTKLIEDKTFRKKFYYDAFLGLVVTFFVGFMFLGMVEVIKAYNLRQYQQKVAEQAHRVD